LGKGQPPRGRLVAHPDRLTQDTVKNLRGIECECLIRLLEAFDLGSERVDIVALLERAQLAFSQAGLGASEFGCKVEAATAEMVKRSRRQVVSSTI
jgi:hypothetical protein